MKNLKAKAVCVMLSASMAAMGLTGCGSENVDGTKTAITVNDESITLGQANFMLRYQQATMYNYYSRMYSMYGMQMPSEMYDKEGDDGKTTGETFKEQSLETIEKEILMRQHAEEYGISLTDEEKQQAKEAAQAFADKNGDDVMKKLHATVEDIQDALELYVIQTRIYDPIIADVDTEVSDEEAKQTSISYITVSTAGTEKDDDGKTIDLTDEEKAAKKEIAQRFLDLLKESEDPAAASFTDLRKELNDQLNAENTADSTDSADSSDESSSSSDASSASTSSSSDSDSSSEVSYLTSSETSFGTGSEKDDDDTCSLGDKVAEEAAKLKDGEYYDGVIEGDDAYYVIRVDKAFDEDKTESRRQTIISNRKSDKYNDTLDGWVKESDIKVASNWKKLEVTDADLYTMTVDSASTDSTDETTTDSTATDSTTSDSTTSGSTETTSTGSTSDASTSSGSAE